MQIERTPKRRGIGRRWIGITLLLALLGLGSAGALYQLIATRLDQRNFPAPGQLVDVGGYRIHLYSSGANQGNPTVIMLGCGGCTVANWGWVQPEVAKFTRVVTFDRAGLGWSDPGPEPRDARQNVQELHTALEKTGIPGPYVLVGHSYGGPLARVYAAQYPTEVVGMVLLDPRHPDQDKRMPPAWAAADKQEKTLIWTLGWMARFGLLRLTDIGYEQAKDLPPDQAAQYAVHWATTQYWQSVAATGAAIEQTDAETRNNKDLGTIPLIVISATAAWLTPSATPDEVRRVYTALNLEQAALSSNSLHREVAGATHTSLVNKREDAQVTIDAIHQVVEAATSGKPLTK